MGLVLPTAIAALLGAGLSPASPSSPAGYTSALSIVAPANGSLIRGTVRIVVSDTAPATSVSFERSSDGSTWSAIAFDSDPADGFAAIWDTAGYSRRTILRASDSFGNQTHIRVRVDNTPPALRLIVGPASFSPDGDGRLDRAELRVSSSETASLTLQVMGPRGLVVQTEARGLEIAPSRARSFLWDGTIYDGLKPARDGVYTIRATASDAAGNRTTTIDSVRIDTRAPLIRDIAVSPRQPSRGPVAVGFSLADADGRLDVHLELFDAWGNLVRSSESRALAPGRSGLILALRDLRDRPLSPGTYRVGVAASDPAGNHTDPTSAVAGFLYSRAVSARVWGRFDGVGRRVALTFDDCYDAAGWSGVLDVLAQEHVQATFFCTGQAVLGSPSLGLRTVREGHVVGSHGWDHSRFGALSYGSAVERLVNDRNVWLRLAGISPTPYFRPPYGSYSSTTMAAAGDAGYAAVVLWDVDPFDWLKPGPSVVAQRVLSATRPGSIDLMHTLPGTAEALPAIIAGLRERGYTFMTLPQLALLGTPTSGHWAPLTG